MKKVIHIEGMSCQNCAKHVKEALEDFKATDKATVSLEAKTAELVSSEEISDADIRAAIEEAGYTVSSIEKA
ncbi:MAG: heavy-metal-associated domain-containing protein [Synergistaceae bacterium]|nr:heavy-metal-associated domain-containing protein [Synergistaceae bacterium]